MKIAYCISAYTDPQQCGRLINALHRDAHFFIHLDKKVEISAYKGAVERILFCGAGQHSIENVHYVKQLPIKWGTLSQVDYQMEMLRAACDFSVDFDYIFMLSAFDYPIWSNSAISQYLELNKGHEFLWAIAAESTYYLCDLQREIYPDFEIKLFGCQLNRILRAIERKICKFLRIRKPKRFFCGGAEMVVYKGSDYFCITKSLARFAIEQYSTHKEIAKHFKDTFAPSETVIHTIAFNSQFKDKCILVDPPYKGLWSLTPLHYIYGCNIKVLGLEDYDKLVESGKMFARKFRTGVSDDLILRIEDSRK